MHELRPPQAPPFSGVDLRRPKGYPPAPPVAAAAVATATVAEGDPCPRCDSRDTKFCYYNNYNTSQPRHFCKCCRRYWTKGGTLRNVPVGGGTRKNSSSTAAKRPKPSKRRRVAPPEPSATPAAETTTQTPTEAASEVTTELAVPAAEEGGFTSLMQSDPTAAFELGISDPGGKAAADPDTFEWPPAFDLGAYWNTNGFADSDPTLFLNFP